GGNGRRRFRADGPITFNIEGASCNPACRARHGCGVCISRPNYCFGVRPSHRYRTSARDSSKKRGTEGLFGDRPGSMLLRIANLQARYGENQVLFDVSLEIRSGEVATLLGRNGMGKTTTILSIFGIVKPSGGEISFEGIQTQTMS